MLKKIRPALKFIKFSHTVFALPFALISMLTAARGLPGGRVLALILVCMVGARTAAMAFNRIVDWEFDKKNPRTAYRHQLLSRRDALLLCGANLGIFLIAAAAINKLCLFLAPLAILLILGYSLTKRFTSFSHAFLGLALAAAPMGAWAAVRGELWSPAPWLLAAGVLCWVFGFDLIYATMDAEFDRAHGLHSFPARFGIGAAIRLAAGLQTIAWLCFLFFGVLGGLGKVYLAGLVLVAFALGAELWLCRTSDMKRINWAFFQANAIVSVVLLASAALEFWV
ncbi:MAG: putative 4-hydroxybenzoate polyprenyltransferase [Verrucomicrobium sp.]|nr:putative 4-hydroxybenzoate polyprenyltransferase [Verrucomicrobium sp.]